MTTYSHPGPVLTLFSEDGRALMHHPDPATLRQSILYVSDDITPIRQENEEDEEEDDV